MQLSREIFSQYSDIAREIEMLERKKAETERSIAKLIEDGLVKDKVYGGNGGLCDSPHGADDGRAPE